MTDSAEAGSVVAETQPAGTPAQPDVSTGNGSSADATSPFSGLSEGTRKWVETKGLKSYEDIALTAQNAESKLGSSFSLPADDAPEEEWNEKFYSRLPERLRPVESPDKLEFKLPEGLPEDLPYSADLANASKDWMTEARLNPGQAQAMHDKFVGFMAEQAQAQQAQMAQSVEDTHDALVKDWGAPESEEFKAGLAIADRAAKELGLVDVFKAKGILLPDGSLTDPQIARAMRAVGDAMFKEDAIGADGVRSGENPFKKPPAERNVTEISALFRSDPERAKRLAREAGEDPSVWMPTNPL